MRLINFQTFRNPKWSKGLTYSKVELLRCSLPTKKQSGVAPYSPYTKLPNITTTSKNISYQHCKKKTCCHYKGHFHKFV